MFGILYLFAVVFIIVLAFKKDKTVTTITRKDENGKEITETIETEHMKEAVMLRKAFNNFMETE